MKKSKVMMDMTITVEIVDSQVQSRDLEKVFAYFQTVDERFSFYKKTSEVGRLNSGELKPENYSAELKKILALAEQTKKETNGYFNIVNREGKVDPSGIVKGWAIYEAAKILWAAGFKNFFIDAGGDIQTSGKNASGEDWTVGIRSPFKPEKEIVKVLTLDNKGVATSGTYARGQHVYNPYKKNEALSDIISLTVIGPNVYEADRIATAALVMGNEGISFIENLKGFEGYAIDAKGIATMTSNFKQYVKNN
jgi:thiamine biosynthesis lipoprotein